MTAWISRLLLLVQLLIALGSALALSRYGQWPALAAIAGGSVISLLVHAFIVLIQFVLSVVAGDTRTSEHRLGLYGWLVCMTQEVAGSVVTFLIRQPFFGALPLPSASGASPHAPILFIHGYFCNRAVWRPAARWFAERGHVTGSVNLEPVYGSIDDYPAIIEEAVRALCAHSGQQKVVLVCHSMGGMAARAYLRTYGRHAIAHVFTLGTPHRGTWLAQLGHGTNSRQMCLASPWRNELERAEPAGFGAGFTTILTLHDNVVAPQSIQTVPGATVHRLKGKGHIWLALDTDVWQIIADELPARWQNAQRRV